MRLSNLLCLQFDRLSIEEDTLALVRLWLTPLSDLRRKLCYNLLVTALQKNTCRLGRACLNALRNPQFNWV